MRDDFASNFRLRFVGGGVSKAVPEAVSAFTLWELHSSPEFIFWDAKSLLRSFLSFDFLQWDFEFTDFIFFMTLIFFITFFVITKFFSFSKLLALPLIQRKDLRPHKTLVRAYPNTKS